MANHAFLIIYIYIFLIVFSFVPIITYITEGLSLFIFFLPLSLEVSKTTTKICLNFLSEKFLCGEKVTSAKY